MNIPSSTSRGDEARSAPQRRMRLLGAAAALQRSLFCAALLGSLVSLSAQQSGRTPRLGYLFPAGAQRGATCEITLGGQFLAGAKEMLVSGSGIKITIVRIEKPLVQKRFNELRDYLMDARKKLQASPGKPWEKPNLELPDNIARILTEAGATEEEIGLFLKDRKQRMDPKRQQNQQLAETGVLKVELAPDAPLGPREVRILTPLGVSNPISFCVGHLPEQRKERPLDKTAAMQASLPVVINGQILPGEVDHFEFKSRRGAHLVVAVQARDLIPFLADAVPGWFQPVAFLYNEKGKEVAFSKDYRFSPDPVFCYEVAESGTFLLEIRDALYRGREDFVYRITVGEIPFVTGIFPLGGRVGQPASVSVEGWNLKPTVRLGPPVRLGPQKQVAISPSPEVGIRPVPNLSNGRVIAEAVFASDVLPEVGEREDGKDRESDRLSPPLYAEARQVQKVQLPVIVNGRIDSPGDVDAYSFRCTEGSKIVAEVQARRLNSPLDSWLKVTDPNGRQIAFNDDWQELGGGYLTHKADAYLTFTAPSTGVYQVSVGDSQHKGGPEFAYRLRISPPQPDFALRFVPSGVNGRPGLSVPVTLYALRKDGFSGDIACALKDAPAGFSLDGGLIQEGQDKVRATLTFPPDPVEKPVSLTVLGTGTISQSGSDKGDGVVVDCCSLFVVGWKSAAGAKTTINHQLTTTPLSPCPSQSGSDREVTHLAIPSEDMLQAFMYHHLVPANSLIAVTSGSSRRVPPFSLVKDGGDRQSLSPPFSTIKLPAGGVGRAVFAFAKGSQRKIADIHLDLSEPIDGIVLDGVSEAPGGIAVSFRTDPAIVKPGLGGNLVLELFNESTPPPKDGKPQEKRRNPAGFLPAIPFKVVEGGQ